MDKNTLVGFALMGAVIIGFGIYNRPSQEEMERAQHYRDSIQAVAEQQEELEKAREAQAALPVIPDSTSSFFQASTGTEQTVTLENDLITLTLSNKGARICKAVLKDYNDQQRQPLTLFDGEDASLNFGFEGKHENILTRQLYFQTVQVTDSTVTLRLPATGGGELDFTYRLLPNSYLVDLAVQA